MKPNIQSESTYGLDPVEPQSQLWSQSVITWCGINEHVWHFCLCLHCMYFHYSCCCDINLLIQSHCLPCRNLVIVSLCKYAAHQYSNADLSAGYLSVCKQSVKQP